MTKKTDKKKGNGGASVAQTTRELMKGIPTGFEPDGEFMPGQEFSPFGQPRSQGEIVRDRLIASCRAADGWYIRLEKDTGTNEFEYKDKITTFDNWTDLKTEITEFVRAKTRAEIKRVGKPISYGSGRYMVTFLNVNGNRDQETIIFPVDAQEHLEEIPASLTGVPGSIDVSDILRTIKETQSPPANIVQAQVDAVSKGMELALQREDKKETSSNAMMTAMFGMMGTIIAGLVGKPAPVEAKDPMAMMNEFFNMAKNMGVMGQEKPQAKSLADTIAELKLLGIKVGENDDPFSVLNKVKSIVGLFREMTGGGDGSVEPPSLAEKAIDRLMTPEVVMAVLNKLPNGGASSGQAPVIQRRVVQPQIPPRQQPVVQEPERVEAPAPEMTTVQTPAEVQPQINMEDAAMFGQIQKFAAELKEAVTNDDFNKFPYITETISKFTKDSDFNIKIGKVTAEEIIRKIMFIDGQSYSDPAMQQKLVNYVVKYIEFVRSRGAFFALCPKCDNFCEFENRQHFDSDNKVCGSSTQNGACDGIVKAVY